MLLNRKSILFSCILLGAVLFLSSCGTARKTGRIKGTAKTHKSKTELTQIDKMLNFAQQYVGTRYRYGGETPREGFDCSGFANFVFAEFHTILPRVSRDIAKEGSYVGKNELQKGDLVFFATGRRSRINHLGIIVETFPNVLMIHASTSKGVRIDNINDEYYRKRYVTARRIKLR